MGALLRNVCRFIANYSLLGVWVAVNALLFWWSFFRFHHEQRYHHVRQILGLGLCVSRGTATVLHVTVCLTPVTVSRSIHLMIARVSLPRRVPALCTAILRRARSAHIALAVIILIASVIHTISHVVNAINFSHHYNYKYPEINWAAYPGQNPLAMIFTSVVGISGVGMLLILTVMAVSSIPRVRSSHYNLFWFSHHLALPFLLLYVVHPLSGVIKEVVNTDEYSPNCEETNDASNSTIVACKEPIFRAPGSIAWLCVTLPVLLLIFDFGVRLACTKREVSISSAGALPGAAVEISLSSPGFSCTPGQYVLLQCPSVSALEWHPYTVIKCPSKLDSHFTVIMRARGDWSRAVCNNVLQAARSNNYIRLEKLPHSLKTLRLYVNGPFASPLQRVLSCKNVVCIGAGVGITPFASVLRYMLEEDASNTNLPERLYLIWLSPDPYQLLWFAWTISSLHNKYWNDNKPDRFQFSIHITKNYDAKYIQKFVGERYPLVACRTEEGRPQWNVVFQQLCHWNSDKVHVFGCGSSSLMSTLSRQCDKASRVSKAPKFNFIREAYS